MVNCTPISDNMANFISLLLCVVPFFISTLSARSIPPIFDNSSITVEGSLALADAGVSFYIYAVCAWSAPWKCYGSGASYCNFKSGEYVNQDPDCQGKGCRCIGYGHKSDGVSDLPVTVARLKEAASLRLSIADLCHVQSQMENITNALLAQTTKKEVPCQKQTPPSC